MKIGNNDISKIYLGGSEITSIYLGTSQVYSGGSEPAPVPYSGQYLTIESTSDNNTISLVATKTAITRTISASTDNGVTWTEYTSSTGGTQIASLNNGQKVLLKGENSTYASSLSFSNIRCNYFTSSGQFNAYGNMMSLISGDSFVNADTLTATYTFGGLFSGCTGLTSAENLILPATTLAGSSYRRMFTKCSSLTVAPELPATTLADYCYNGMFAYCSNLTVAPELPATTLVSNCYFEMFNGCTNLNYIKCLATDISATGCTNNWVSNVSSTGTFVKAASMYDWECGNNGIPEGWSVEDEYGNPETNPCDELGGGEVPIDDGGGHDDEEIG